MEILKETADAYGTHLFLNDSLIARRDSEGQVYAIRNGMNAEAEAILRGSGKLGQY